MNRPFPRYDWLNAKFICTYQSLAFNFDETCSREIETNDSIIIILFPSLMSILNQSIVNQNYIENEVLVSTVDFRVQSRVSWERSVQRTLGRGPKGVHLIGIWLQITRNVVYIIILSTQNNSEYLYITIDIPSCLAVHMLARALLFVSFSSTLSCFD